MNKKLKDNYEIIVRQAQLDLLTEKDQGLNIIQTSRQL